MRSPFRWAVLFSFALAVPGYAYRMSAWVPNWDSNAVTIMQQHAGDLNEANPTWYQAAADGTLTGAEDLKLRAALTGIALVPTIQNYGSGGFNGSMIATIVGSPTLREKHAEAITQLTVTKVYDGIDIDYEAVPTASRANFTLFVQLLASKLHGAGKKLSITVHPKTSDSQNWDGPGSQDWIAIGAAADYVKIMAYDYHWSTSAAGALAPLDWINAVAAYAEKSMVGSKVIMALPWYGYDWLNQNGVGVTYAEATARAQSAGVTVGHDVNGEATYSYSGRTVFFQDASSYKRKVDSLTAAHPGIGGFAAWRVGAEDPAIWPIVAQLRLNGSTPIEQPAKDFAISGPTSLSVTAGTNVSAQYSYVGINGFADAVTVTTRVVDAFGGTVSLSTPSISSSSSTTMTVAVPATTAANTYRVAVTMAGGGVTHEQIVSVRVSAPAVVGSFTLNAAASVEVVVGNNVDVPVTLLPVSGWNGTASITATMLDGFNGSVALTQPTLGANGTTTARVTANKKATPGTYRLQVTATSGNLTDTRIISVVVAAASTKRRVA